MSETIQAWLGLGEDMQQASKEFDRTEGEFADGAYKKAYDGYRKAYEHATKK